MKRKVLLKASTFQKVENTRGTDIKGALNLNKEVLDTLVDKDVLATTDCCSYFPIIPVLNANDYPYPGLPDGSFFIENNGDSEYYLGIKINNTRILYSSALSIVDH